MDLYAEYLVTRKKTLFDYIIYFLMVFAGITATLSLAGFLFVQVYGMIAALAIAAVWYVVYYVIISRHIEFEYSVCEGVMDVDMIIGKRKRKKIAEIQLLNAEIIAPATVEYIECFNKEGITRKLDASMNDSGTLDFFVIYNDDDKGMARLVFTPNQSVLDAIKKINPRNTFYGQE